MYAHSGAVFLADDEDDLRDTLQDWFEEEGFLVLPAREGAEALARMSGFTGSAVVIVDLVMPGMDGWRLIDAMRARPDLARIPVIVLSAYGSPPAGVARVFRKPYDPDALLDSVRELIQRGC